MTINVINYRGCMFIAGKSKKFDNDLDRVIAILDKPAECITAADRAELLSIYKVSYHETGKIAGVSSLDSSATNCAFCKTMRAAAGNNAAHICGRCYDFAQEQYKLNSLNRHSLNMLIMMTVEFSPAELQRLSVTKITRVNSSGDTPNMTYAKNMIRLAMVNPWARFAYWAKNTRPIIAACDEIGKPENLVLIQSSCIIGRPAPLAKYFDYSFTVYADKDSTAAAIAAGAAVCNGTKCADCGYKCYFGAHTAGANIAEYLRGVSAADRAIIAAAV